MALQKRGARPLARPDRPPRLPPLPQRHDAAATGGEVPQVADQSLAGPGRDDQDVHPLPAPPADDAEGEPLHEQGLAGGEGQRGGVAPVEGQRVVGEVDRQRRRLVRPGIEIGVRLQPAMDAPQGPTLCLERLARQQGEAAVSAVEELRPLDHRGRPAGSALGHRLSELTRRVDRVEADARDVGVGGDRRVAGPGPGRLAGDGIVHQHPLGDEAGETVILDHHRVGDQSRPAQVDAEVGVVIAVHGVVHVFGHHDVGPQPASDVRQLVDQVPDHIGAPRQVALHVGIGGDQDPGDGLPAGGPRVGGPTAGAGAAGAGDPGIGDGEDVEAHPGVVQEDAVGPGLHDAADPLPQVLPPGGVVPAGHVAAGIVEDAPAPGIPGVPRLFPVRAGVDAVGELDVAEDADAGPVEDLHRLGEALALGLVLLRREAPVEHQVGPVEAGVGQHARRPRGMRLQMDAFVDRLIHELEVVHPHGVGPGPEVDGTMGADGAEGGLGRCCRASSWVGKKADGIIHGMGSERVSESAPQL